ncbi:hypothetical protein WJX84_004353, partial [Apatococcus fuscideae]
MQLLLAAVLCAAFAAASPIEPGWFFSSLPSSAAEGTKVNAGSDAYTIYHNLWYHNQRYLALV